MRIISPVTAELTDAELVTIQRALERWSGMDDELAQLIGAVAETGSTFTLATKAPEFFVAAKIIDEEDE